MSKAAELAALIGSQTALSNRNMIINGAMRVAQRGTQTTGVTSSGFGADRFQLFVNSLGTYTISQSTEAPDGFSNSFKIDCTTADASPAAGDYNLLTYKPEAQDLQSLAYGTSSAKSMTLSFWVRSNKTGSFGVVVRQSDNSNKMVSKEISISATNTWEHKTMYIPADTSGVINNDNGQGMDITWWINSGSTYSGGSEITTWATEDNTAKYLGDIDIGALTTDEFYITGVQLELGEQATPFEHRSYGDELARCQRYYYQIGDSSTNTVAIITKGYDGKSTVPWHHPQSMRASPTMTTLSSDNSSTGTIISYVSIDENGCRQQAYQASNNTFIVYSFKADAEL